MELHRLNGALGARVDGIDWSGEPSAEVAELLAEALEAHHVVVVGATAMVPAQHVALAASFGELEHHEFFDNLGPGAEHITVLDSERGDKSNMWHIDEQFLTRPPMITLTRAIELPAWGGDTGFISLHAAYEALSVNMQRYLEDLRAVHDLSRVAEMAWQGGRSGPGELAQSLLSGRQASHPVVLTHPRSGRRGLYVSPTYTRFIEGLPMAEGQTVLEFLYRHVLRPEFAYRHRWAPGDLVIWDNRSVMHHAAFDYDGRRVMHRISVLAPA